MISSARFLPMFGVASHTPGLCREPDANPDEAVDPRTGLSRPKRRKHRQTKVGPCVTCGGRILVGSTFVCMGCHGVAPDVAAKVERHALPALEYDARYGDGLEKQRAKAAADAKAAKKKAAKLTKRELRALARDVCAGEHDPAAVGEFLSGLAVAS